MNQQQLRVECSNEYSMENEGSITFYYDKVQLKGNSAMYARRGMPTCYICNLNMAVESTIW
jgi:hypothetical protein